MTSDEMLQTINKHLMGNALDFEKFIELTKRFENFNACSRAGAAALGYLIAKDELEAEKEKEEEKELDVYDEAIEVIKKYCHPPGNISAHTATDEIFTLIYEWLEDSLAGMGYEYGYHLKSDIKELFKPFIIKKPE
jgi:hypothetical protein